MKEALQEEIKIGRIIAKESFKGFLKGMSYTYCENEYSEAFKYIVIDELGKINSLTKDCITEHFDIY